MTRAMKHAIFEINVYIKYNIEYNIEYNIQYYKNIFTTDKHRCAKMTAKIFCRIKT